MQLTSCTTALSLFLFVLAHSSLVSTVHAAPLTARNPPEKTTVYTIDKQGNRISFEEGRGKVIPNGQPARDSITEIIQAAFPHTALDQFSFSTLVNQESVEDKDRMVYAQVTGEGLGCSPCYLWSARKEISGRWKYFGAVLRQKNPPDYIVGGIKNAEPGRPNKYKEVWQSFQDRALNELKPVGEWKKLNINYVLNPEPAGSGGQGSNNPGK